jgi:hypothetical protein
VLFEKFKQWAGGANFDVRSYPAFKFLKDFTAFMKKEEIGVGKKRTAKGYVFIINWTKLESCLKRHGLFNANAI